MTADRESDAVRSPEIPCQGPDPAPRKPAMKVPRGACDCHAHIFGPPERYPYRPDRRYTPAPAGLDEYRHMLATLGLEHAVIVQPAIYLDNRVTLDALRGSGGSWRGVALLDAGVTEREVAELHAAGFRGVRFNPRNNKEAGLRGLEEVAARIKPFGWHVQFHLDGRDLPELAPRLERLPVDIVIDHMGRVPPAAGVAHPGFQRLLALARDGRCWVKLSAPDRFGDPRPPYENVAPFARALVAAAPERLVWASDWPHSSRTGYMPNDGELLDLLALWAPDPAVRKRILVDNPATLYGF
ncbi:MAG: amidohydrolase family protein [Betaproteobacteria bacterium]|nr:amidohydrolase family protein [Betaproteobacteria bacterium]